MDTVLLRALAQGESGTWKTGSLAALLERYRVVLANFDNNTEPLLIFGRKHLANLHVVNFADELSGSDEGVRKVNKVSALRQFVRFMTSGNADLGAPRTWGPDTVFVLDSITSLCRSGMRLALALSNGSTREGRHIGILQDEVEPALELFVSPFLNCHRIAIAHLKLVSPKAETGYPDETPLQKQVKRERAALEETGYFTDIPGLQLARRTATLFSTALLYELNGKGEAVIRTKPIKGFTVKVPALVADPLPAATGLLTIIESMNGRGG